MDLNVSLLQLIIEEAEVSQRYLSPIFVMISAHWFKLICDVLLATL